MEKKNKNGVIIGVVIGIVLMLVVVFVLFVTGTINFNIKTNNNGSVNKSIKIDDSKYYVYVADYETNTSYQEYGKAFGNEFDTQFTHDGFNTRIVSNGVLRISDLRVPYININTEEVLKINHDLKELYDKYVKYYVDEATKYNNTIQKNGTNFDGNPGLYGYPMVNYYTYEANNILSIVVTYGYLGTDVLYPEYLVYNFDLLNGELLDYDQFLSKFSLTRNQVLSQFEVQITNYVSQLPKEYGVYDSVDYGGIDTTYFNLTKKYFKESVDNGDALFFVDNQGNINCIVDVYWAVGRGNYPQKITLSSK